MNRSTLSVFLKISAVLWIIWGAVHVLAGVMVMKGHIEGNPSASVIAVADAEDPTSLTMDYPKAAGALMAQHGFNLFWIGIVTFICAFYIWRKNGNAIFLAAITGGLADIGYFIFLDLGGHVHFVPGTVMTLVSASAIILSFIAYFQSNKMELFKDAA
ncbi:MAG: hypothetical protein AAFY71_26410 [Bacteroidota bacterium]